MESYKKASDVKKEYTQLLLKFDDLKRLCNKKTNEIENINDRISAYEKCFYEPAIKIRQEMSDFKSVHGIKETDEYNVYSSIDKIYAGDNKKEEKEYPLTKDKEWLEIYNGYKKHNNQSYIKNYFDTNTAYLFLNLKKTSESRLCCNNKYMDGQYIKADDLIKCIKKVNELHNN